LSAAESRRHEHGEPRADGRGPLIREVRMEDGGLILYDPDSEEAWIQADGPDSVK
jgi:hypothetical protein